MREKKIPICNNKSRQATTYLSGFFNYLQLMRKKKSNNHTIPYYNCMKSFTYLQF